MNEKEKRIKDQRTIEANANNLVGITGKLGIILKTMGEPIISHHGCGDQSIFFGYTSTERENDWLNDRCEENELPTMEMYDLMGNPIQEPEGPEWSKRSKNKVNLDTTQLGWHFDGLSRGVHLEIKYLDDQALLTVHYKGYPVYEELAGDIRKYTPFPEWEEKVDSFHKVAKKKYDLSIKEEKKERIEEAKKNKKTWIEHIRKTWGI